MSTILKALRRLEEDRRAEEAERDLRGAVAAEDRGSPSRGARVARSGLLVLLVAVVGGGLGLAAGWIWLVPGVEPARVARTPAVPASRPPVAAPPPRAQPPIAPPAPRAPEPIAAAPEPEPEPEPAPEVRRAPETGPATWARPPAPPAAPKPDVTLASTVWHPSADRRIAFVSVGSGGEAKQFREGQRIAGWELVKISPSSVTLRRDGVEVLERIGSH